MNLLRNRSWTGRRELGVLLLGAWLVIVGLLPLLGFTSGVVNTVINVLAIAAGLALLFRS